MQRQRDAERKKGEEGVRMRGSAGVRDIYDFERGKGMLWKGTRTWRGRLGSFQHLVRDSLR